MLGNVCAGHQSCVQRTLQQYTRLRPTDKPCVTRPEPQQLSGKRARLLWSIDTGEPVSQSTVFVGLHVRGHT